MGRDLEERVRLLERGFREAARDMGAAARRSARLRDWGVRISIPSSDPPTMPAEPGADPVPCCGDRRLPEVLRVRSIVAATLDPAPAPSYSGDLTYNGGQWESPEVSVPVFVIYGRDGTGRCVSSPVPATLRGKWALSCEGASWWYRLLAESVTCRPIGGFGDTVLPSPGTGAFGRTAIGGSSLGGAGRCEPFNLSMPYGGTFDLTWGDWSTLYRAIVYEP